MSGGGMSGNFDAAAFSSVDSVALGLLEGTSPGTIVLTGSGTVFYSIIQLSET